MLSVALSSVLNDTPLRTHTRLVTPLVGLKSRERSRHLPYPSTKSPLSSNRSIHSSPLVPSEVMSKQMAVSTLYHCGVGMRCLQNNCCRKRPNAVFVSTYYDKEDSFVNSNCARFCAIMPPD